MRREHLWYVVINSNQARLLRSLPAPDAPPPIEIRLQAMRRNLRNALRDRPTRGHALGGGETPAVKPAADPLYEDALRFLHEVFLFLSDEQAAQAFDGLVLIGSPDIVGLWRSEIPDALRKSIRREVTRNLVRLPISELVPAIRALMAE